MPKHIDEQKKWELFLTTISNSLAIKVNEVSGNNIYFNAEGSTLDKLKQLLASPRLLQESIVHALPNQTNDISYLTQDLQDTNISREELDQMSSFDVMSKLLDKEYLKSLGIDSNKFIDCKETKIATLEFETENKLRLKKLLTNIEILQSALSDQDLVTKMLDDHFEPIKGETGEVTDFGKSILNIRKNSETRAMLKFNYGLILQHIQNKFTSFQLAPVIASDSNGNYIISKPYLLKYLYNIISSGVVFKEEGANMFLPLLFQPQSKAERFAESNSLFYILLDRSGSMATNFLEFKEKIRNVVKNIVDKTPNWKIKIISFNNNYEERHYESSRSNDKELMQKDINDLRSDGGTALNRSFAYALDQMKQNISLYSNSTIILFTDGFDSECYNDVEDENINQSINLRKANNNFSIFTMGFGDDYKKEYFDRISQKGGFTHIHLNKIEQIKEFDQYINTLNSNKIVWEFINAAKEIFYEQCPVGDITIGQTSLSQNDEVRHDGQTYKIGTIPQAVNHTSVTEKDNYNRIKGPATARILNEKNIQSTLEV